MKAYSFKFQIYADHSQIYISNMNFSPKILTGVLSTTVNISTQISNSNFKLKLQNRIIYMPLSPPSSPGPAWQSCFSFMSANQANSTSPQSVAVQWKTRESYLSPLLLSCTQSWSLISVASFYPLTFPIILYPNVITPVQTIIMCYMEFWSFYYWL